MMPEKIHSEWCDDHGQFHLGFHGLDSDFDQGGGAVSMTSSLTQESQSSQGKWSQQHEFKTPIQENELTSLFNKQFAPETMKKLKWGANMYLEWRETCNKNPDIVHIYADIHDVSSLTKCNLCYALC